ncbi:hypothetical protein PUN28_002356 [Cardiocondyla obscurior]|uniref:Uncharacterized protein n=1 Tax=Cardiocondyla obscurior TaxID=286306 RepID=A0AAW2GTV4_9HYME
MEAGLLTTTTSSSMCITVIGSEVTGTSCLQHTNRNQLNVALFRLRLHISHTHTRARGLKRTHVTHAHIFIHTRDRRVQLLGTFAGSTCRPTRIEANRVIKSARHGNYRPIARWKAKKKKFRANCTYRGKTARVEMELRIYLTLR